MGRKKRHPEHANHERWLVSYADFITLLFAFFVVMFASSRVDEEKVKKVARSVSEAFNPGVFPPASSRLDLDGEGRRGGDPGRGGDRRLQAVETELRTWVREVGSESAVLRREPRGLVLSLSEAGFFGPGRTAPHPESLPQIDALARAAAEAGMPLKLEGHTDDSTARGGTKGNWEISASRAIWLADRLIEQHGFPPERISVSGYGHHRPLVSNATPEGRALNRRVDVVFLTEVAAAQEPKPGAAAGPNVPRDSAELIEVLGQPSGEGAPSGRH